MFTEEMIKKTGELSGSDNEKYRVNFNVMEDQQMKIQGQYQGNTNGMWILESQEYQKGEILRVGTSYKIKHLSSGMYLVVNRGKRSIKQKKGIEYVDLDSSPTEKQSLWEFSYLNKEEEQFKYDAVKGVLICIKFPLKIKHVDTGRYLATFVDETNVEKDEEAFGTIDDPGLECMLMPQPIENHIFKIIKSNATEVWETNLLLSCLPILEQFCYNYHQLMFKKSNPFEYKPKSFRQIKKALSSAMECIQNLTDFVQNKIVISSNDQKYGYINNVRQRLLREQYYFDILTKILHFILTKDDLEQYEEGKRWENSSERAKFRQKGKSHTIRLMRLPTSQLSLSKHAENRQYFQKKILNLKIHLTEQIYSLIEAMCYENKESQ